MAGSLCVVGHLLWPLLAATDDPVVGGAEVQAYHLAEELARRRWRVEFLVCSLDEDPSPRRETALGPAEVLFRRRVPKGLGTKLREKAALWRAVRRTPSALVYERAVWDADVAALAARRAGVPFVYGLASDRDAVALPRWSRRRNVLRWATAVVAQTELQRDWLHRYGRDGVCIPSGFPLPPRSVLPRREVLWVGTLRALKRPEVFLDLAAEHPEHPFVLCGGPGEDAAIAERIAARARAFPNVRYLGFVPYRRIQERFARARILVNTSTYEGFPNTFVLAWLHGAAVLSLGVDPDGALSRRGLGVACPDPAALGAALRRLQDDDGAWRELTDRARAHAEAEHDICRVAGAYEQLFASLGARR